MFNRISKLMGWAGTQLNDDTVNPNKPPLRDILNELQGLSQQVVAGAGASTPITVPGMSGVDTLVQVVEFTAGVPSLPGGFSILPNGQIESANSTTGNPLLVTWYKKVPAVLVA